MSYAFIGWFALWNEQLRGYDAPAYVYYVAAVLFRFYWGRNVSLSYVCLFVLFSTHSLPLLISQNGTCSLG